MEYVRFCGSSGIEKTPDKGVLIEANKDYSSLVKDWEQPYYIGAFKYKTKHQDPNGITDVTTNKLWWDFDSEGDRELARQDTVCLIERLISHGVDVCDILVCFSGHKGFYVQVETDKTFVPEEVASITEALSKDLNTYDERVYNASRIFRIPGTKHPKSGLYRTVLDTSDFPSMSMLQILEQSGVSVQLDPTYHAIVPLPDSIYGLRIVKKILTSVIPTEKINIDFSRKPKGWSNCKWAMSLGYGVKDNDRHDKIVCLAATCLALNYTEHQAHYHIKNATEQGVELYGGEEVPKEEIWKQVRYVYSPAWEGGSYSCKNGKTTWLSKLCESLGPHRCKAQDLPVVTASEVFSLFENYAINFEKNIITTGIKPLDEKARFLMGTSNAILAGPASGKTSLSLDILNHNSKQNINSIFFSYDMFHSLVYMRLIQKHYQLKDLEIFDIFKHNKKRANEIRAGLEEEYKNVHFCFKSGQTAEEIQETIRDTQERSGNKVKLVVVDYNELVITNISDPTQSSAQVAQKLRQIANEEEVCAITLLQPAKVFSNPAEEIKTYQGAKGSGAIAQSVSLMLSLSRPGFSPRTPEHDRYITINALKNRQGPLFSQDFSWDGLTGKIREMTFEEERELANLRAALEAEKSSKEGDGW